MYLEKCTHCPFCPNILLCLTESYLSSCYSGREKLPSFYRTCLLVGKVGEKERKKGKKGGRGLGRKGAETNKSLGSLESNTWDRPTA